MIPQNAHIDLDIFDTRVLSISRSYRRPSKYVFHSDRPGLSGVKNPFTRISRSRLSDNLLESLKQQVGSFNSISPLIFCIVRGLYHLSLCYFAHATILAGYYLLA
jgi:hypothetical protein